MRKLILNLCISLDSFIEGPNGEIDWCFTDQDYSMTEFLNRTDSIFFGRKSYDQFIREVPDAFPDKEKFVFTKTKNYSSVNLNVISDDIENVIKEILNQPGKDIWLFGGASITTTFLNLNLVDELMLSVHPLILGSGKSLFFDIQNRKKLKLTDTKTFSTGLVQLYYEIEK